MKTSEELEKNAIELWRQYKFFLPGTVKNFLRDVAEFCKWEKLAEELRR